ncbi:ABC transporter substrate-binding protein [Caballeronia sp. LZ043]|nr:ABC transporter substrate-binding protein [Caballeronia sp. LZ043]
MKFGRLIGRAGLLGLMTLSAAAAAAPATPVPGGTLVVGAETELGTRDPAISESGAAARVNQLIFEGLVARDLKADTKGAPPPVVAKLATSWDVSADQLTYTFHLRKNVKFTDGTPFNAQAVVFNVRRVWDPSFQYFTKRAAGIPPFRYLYLKDVKATDDNTVVFTLSKKNSFFVYQLAESASPGLPTIGSPTAIAKYGNDDFGNHPVGTGPFIVTEQVKGQYVAMKRNPDYWNKPYPYVDQLIFRQIPDPLTRVNALRAGEVDMIVSVPPNDVAPLRKDQFIVATNPLPHIWYLTLNVHAKPFDDVRVRRAVAMAIDKDGMARELLRNTAAPAFSMVSRTSPAWDPNWKPPYPYDPVGAKKLLADAGYPNGFSTIYEEATSGSGEMIPVPMAEWIQRDLAKIGIKVALKTYEWNTYLGRWLNGMGPDVGMDQQSWGSNSDFWLQQPFRSTSKPNSGRIDDPQMDGLLDQMVAADSDSQRVGFARKIAERNMSEVYHIPIVSDLGAFAMSQKVHGFVRASDWLEDYTNIWITQ